MVALTTLQIEGRPAVKAYDTTAEMRDLAELTIVPGMSDAGAAPYMKMLAAFNESTMGIVRFSGQTPWERHPGGDELLHVLEGAVEVIVLAETGQFQAAVPAGSIFVVPRGLWHRQIAAVGTTLLFATPTEGSEHSWADDPRTPSSSVSP